MNSKKESDNISQDIRTNYLTIITELISEKLTDWDKRNLLDWLKTHLEECETLEDLISSFSDEEILRNLPFESIVEYLSDWDRLDRFKDELDLVDTDSITVDEMFSKNIIDKTNVIEVLSKIKEEFPDQFKSVIESEVYQKTYDLGFENGYDQALVDYNLNPNGSN